MRARMGSLYVDHERGHMGITWNAVATPLPSTRIFRGITWNSEATTLSSRRILRGVSAVSVAAVLTAVAASGVATRMSRPGGVPAGLVGGGPVPVGIGASPWFADTYTAPDGTPT